MIKAGAVRVCLKWSRLSDCIYTGLRLWVEVCYNSYHKQNPVLSSHSLHKGSVSGEGETVSYTCSISGWEVQKQQNRRSTQQLSVLLSDEVCVHHSPTCSCAAVRLSPSSSPSSVGLSQSCCHSSHSPSLHKRAGDSPWRLFTSSRPAGVQLRQTSLVQTV